MATRPPAPARSTSAASNPSQPQQQQLQQPPLRRTLFSGSLTRRPAASASSSTEALTPHAQGPPSTATQPVSNSGFTPATGFLHGGHTFAYGARTAATDSTADDGGSGDADFEDDGILVAESSGSDAYGKKAASERELLMRFLEEAAAEAAAAGAGGDEGDGGDAAGRDDSARLIELYRSHARQRIDPNEVKPAVQESLRRKVASLQDDKWMYEAESDSEES